MIFATVNSGSGGGGHPSGTVLFQSSVAGPWSFPVPMGVTSVNVQGWGGGGAGSKGYFQKSEPTIGWGGGGAGYFAKNGVSVTGGVDVLSGVVGIGGSFAGATAGGDTTEIDSSCTAHGGAAAVTGTAGAGGTASGGTTNTTGTDGGAVDTWDGGGAGNGGGDQTTPGAAGTPPGGGSAGGAISGGSNGANGQIIIKVA